MTPLVRHSAVPSLLPVVMAFLGCGSGSSSPAGPTSLPSASETPCVQEFSCTEWSACVRGEQTRTCTQVNTCTNEGPKPVVTQACTESSETTSPPTVDASSVTFALGPIEIVYDWEKDHCTDLDLPDVYAHAVRNHLGEIVVNAGNAPVNRFMFGAGFDSLKRDCMPVLTSVDDPKAEALKPMQWITSIYSEDGQTVHALVHNEYHDPFAI